ncbi:MAG TPA: hypothetical protein VHC63_01190 [Acidimicrobiales bacterium]|nr:hypothetical protein [Acidimicrobiales bacterium]
MKLFELTWPKPKPALLSLALELSLAQQSRLRKRPSVTQQPKRRGNGWSDH